MTEHTPGPWTLVEADDELLTRVKSESGERVARCDFDGIDDSIAVSNAKLIAAAPEMLEILLELQEAGFSFDQWNLPITLGDRINEAIRKAMT